MSWLKFFQDFKENEIEPKNSNLRFIYCDDEELQLFQELKDFYKENKETNCNRKIRKRVEMFYNLLEYIFSLYESQCTFYERRKFARMKKGFDMKKIDNIFWMMGFDDVIKTQTRLQRYGLSLLLNEILSHAIIDLELRDEIRPSPRRRHNSNHNQEPVLVLVLENQDNPGFFLI